MVSYHKTLPTYDELTVPEINLSTPAFKAAALRMNQYCETQCKEFMLCRAEERDPRKCLKEGAELTACGIKFLQKVKKGCRDEFEKHAHCIDHSKLGLTKTHWCSETRHDFDMCVQNKLDLGAPMRIGYFAKPHVHQTDRPLPAPQFRDYRKEAEGLVTELPLDYPIQNEYRNFKPYPFTDWTRGTFAGM